MRGVPPCDIAIASFAGEKSTPYPKKAGGVPGSANLVPKPLPDQEYVDMYGELE
jgi:hypothetical protein